MRLCLFIIPFSSDYLAVHYYHGALSMPSARVDDDEKDAEEGTPSRTGWLALPFQGPNPALALVPCLQVLSEWLMRQGGRCTSGGARNNVAINMNYYSMALFTISIIPFPHEPSNTATRALSR